MALRYEATATDESQPGAVIYENLIIYNGDSEVLRCTRAMLDLKTQDVIFVGPVSKGKKINVKEAQTIKTHIDKMRAEVIDSEATELIEVVTPVTETPSISIGTDFYIPILFLASNNANGSAGNPLADVAANRYLHTYSTAELDSIVSSTNRINNNFTAERQGNTIAFTSSNGQTAKIYTMRVVESYPNYEERFRLVFKFDCAIEWYFLG